MLSRPVDREANTVTIRVEGRPVARPWVLVGLSGGLRHGLGLRRRSRHLGLAHMMQLSCCCVRQRQQMLFSRARLAQRIQRRPPAMQWARKLVASVVGTHWRASNRLASVSRLVANDIGVAMASPALSRMPQACGSGVEAQCGDGGVFGRIVERSALVLGGVKLAHGAPRLAAQRRLCRRSSLGVASYALRNVSPDSEPPTTFHISMSPSSSWGAFHGPGTFACQDSVSGPSIAAPGSDFSVVRHDGWVFLTGGDPQHVVHRLTQEIVEVPSGPPADRPNLDFDGDGYGYLYRDNTDAIEWLEDMFELQLVEDKSGRQAIIQKTVDGEKAFAVWVGEYSLCADVGDMKLCIRCGPAAANVSCMVYRIPRSRFRLFLDLYDFLRLLNLNAVASERNPSHFVYKRLERWCKFVHVDLGLPGQLLKSSQYSSTLAAEGEDVERQAAAPHISIVAVVALLVRWASCSTAAGGLKDQEDRDCALRCLRTFGMAGAGCSWDLIVYMQVRDWVSGFGDGEEPMLWHADEKGQLSCNVEQSQFEHASRLGDPRDMSDIVSLLCALGKTPRQFDLFKQVLVQASLVWQGNLLAQANSPKRTGCPISLTVGGAPSEGQSRRAIEQRNAAYWHAGRQWADGQTHFSIAVDKSRVGGRGKQNGALLLPRNFCFWMLPQDLLGGLQISQKVWVGRCTPSLAPLVNLLFKHHIGPMSTRLAGRPFWAFSERVCGVY